MQSLELVNDALINLLRHLSKAKAEYTHPDFGNFRYLSTELCSFTFHDYFFSSH